MGKPARSSLTFMLSVMLTACVSSLAFSLPKNSDEVPVYMQAEKMGYDQKNNIVLALGKVEIYQGESILLADRIAYYQNQNLVKAKGNVSLLEPDGTVYFADEITLQDNLKAGVIENFRIRLSDNSLFAARQAVRVSPSKTKLRKAVYSPCKLCEGSDPLWQIKANKVKIDEAEQKVTYRDAYMEVYGVPVAYTPYFAHPTPGADRKSGILMPEYEQSSNLGTMVKVPYYWNIAPDKDATITPWVTSEEGPVLEGQYRQLTDRGRFQFDGSVTYPRDRDELGVVAEGHDLRGHIFAHGDSAVTANTSVGFDINRASDDTYLRRYEFSNIDSLTSRLYGEYIEDRDYAMLESMAFQGFEVEDDPDRTPYVLPALQAELYTNPLWMRSRARMETRSNIITRRLGSESRRVSVTTGWNLPYITDSGHVLELDTAIRSDYYSISNNVLPDGTEFDGNETRFIPQATLAWRYPMIKQFNGSNVVLEPHVELIASSNGNNPDSIPNEDSIVPEFSDNNLFERERFAGADLVENGSRIVYGVRSQYQYSSETRLRGMIGQNTSLTGDRVFPTSNNLNRDVSDLVGLAGVDHEHFTADYRFRLDPEDGGMRRSEITGSYTDGYDGLFVDYVNINEDPYLEDQENITLSSAYALTPNWIVSAGGQRDLAEEQAILAALGLTYQNECITIYTNAKREYTRDRDIEPNTSISVRVALKNLN